MNPQCILIHYHEIGLKGDNRSWFEKIFINNIKKQLNNLPYTKIKIVAARIFITGIDSDSHKKYSNCLKNVMGLKHAFIMSSCKLDIESINRCVQFQIQNLHFDTFRNIIAMVCFVVTKCFETLRSRSTYNRFLYTSSNLFRSNQIIPWVGPN